MIDALREADRRLRESDAKLREGLLGLLGKLASSGATPGERVEILRTIRELARIKAQLEGRGSLGRISLREVEQAVRDANADPDYATGLLAVRAGLRQARRSEHRCRAKLTCIQGRGVVAAIRAESSPVLRQRGHAPRRGSNRHRSGSRRSGARGDPDDGGDPEPAGVDPPIRLALWGVAA